MTQNLNNSPDLVSRDLYTHEFFTHPVSSVPLSPPSEGELDHSPFCAWSKLPAQDCMSMSSPPLSRQSPPGNALQEYNTQDPYLSAQSDPEESDFRASAIRLTPVAGSPNHSSSPNGSRCPSIQSSPYVPSKPSACLAPSDIELNVESRPWTTECASSLNGGVTAPTVNASWAGLSASNWLNPEPSLESLPPRGRSPIVTVSKVSRGDSPIAHQRRPSRSTAYLSPGGPGDLSSESEHEDIGEDYRSVSSLSVARTHNGNWIRNPSTGLGGLDPSARGDEIVSSPNELKGRRDREQKNQDISLWSASVSAANSDTDDDPLNLPSRRHQQGNSRVRARSTGDRPFQQEDYFNLHLGGDARPVPGPGAMLHESSDEVSEGASEAGESDEGSPPADVNDPSRNDHSAPEVRSSFESGNPDGQFLHPWEDPPGNQKPRAEAMQPFSSTAAMVAFEKRARDLETASRTATIDNNSIINFGASFERLKLGDQPKTKARRSSSLLKRPFFQSSSKLKRQASDISISSINTVAQQAAPELPQRKESNSHRHRLSLSSKHTRSPSLTNALLSMSGQMAAIGGSHSVRAVSPNPERDMKSAPPKSRARSRSEIPRPVTPGLMDLMTTHGGPPVTGFYRSPKPQVEVEPALTSAISQAHVPGADEENDLDVADEKAVVMEFPPMSRLPVPTLEGFQAQIMQLNPRLDPILVHRFAHAQLRRYRQLVELQQQHSAAVTNQACKNGNLCFALGGEASMSQQRKTLAGTEAGQNQFHVKDVSHARDQSPYAMGEGAMTAAHFPPGVPLPPVSHLPAKFECPLCFEVKTFRKPSDWSKHVHEDVQPFTCSFPQCNEPKSFKRKADWVRHESERHRQLEWWTCSFHECSHTCFRKDNFVQHLVREHKLPEPKHKKSNGSAAADGLSDSQREQEVNRLWTLVDDCRHETEHTPAQEPCRFCGNICSSWKKLTVHLGKHMEQLAMPVIQLARQSCILPSQAISTGISGRSAETYPPLATRLPTRQQEARPSSAHLTQTQYPTANTNTPESHTFSYDVPVLNYPSLSGGEISMEPESITNPLQPGDQFSGYNLEQYDPSVLHAQTPSHPLHQNSVTYPPPFNAVPRPRTPEATAVMLQNSYAINAQFHPPSSLYPAQAAYPAAYQPVAQNVPYTSGPYTPGSYTSQM